MTNFEWGCQSPENMLQIARDVSDTDIACQERCECVAAIEAAQSIYDMPDLDCDRCVVAWLNSERVIRKVDKPRCKPNVGTEKDG